MATYQETLTNVRNWMDRDSTIVSDTLILTFLQYAADKAYRSLRVPSLETTLDFTVADSDIIADASASAGTEVLMAAPSDLIEIIYIQEKGKGVVWNQKVDPRTFHDKYADKKDSNYYTRVGNNFLLHGTLGSGDVLEVAYYKRLPKIDAKYDITTANYLAQTSTLTTMTGLASSSGTSTILYFEIANNSGNRDIVNGVSGTRPTSVSATSTGATTNAFHMEPAFIANWLRDENERVLLYGSLVEAFTYLEEPNQMQLYEAKFNEEIARLNKEEKDRVTTGGNTSISFSGMGLI